MVGFICLDNKFLKIPDYQTVIQSVLVCVVVVDFDLNSFIGTSLYVREDPLFRVVKLLSDLKFGEDGFALV